MEDGRHRYLHPVKACSLLREYHTWSRALRSSQRWWWRSLVFHVWGCPTATQMSLSLPLTASSACVKWLCSLLWSPNPGDILRWHGKRKHQHHKNAQEEHRGEPRIEMEKNMSTFPWRICSSFLPLVFIFALGATSPEGHGAFSTSPLRSPGSPKQTFCWPLCDPLPIRAVLHSSLGVWKKNPLFLLWPRCWELEKQKQKQMCASKLLQRKMKSLVPPATVIGRVVTWTMFLCLVSKTPSDKVLKQPWGSGQPSYFWYNTLFPL